MYYKNRVKNILKTFSWKDEELKITDEIRVMYISLKKIFKRAVKEMIRTDDSSHSDATIKSYRKDSHKKNKSYDNNKKHKQKKDTKKRKKNQDCFNEINQAISQTLSVDEDMIKSSFEKIMGFYDSSNVFMVKILEQLFHPPMSNKKCLFILLNKLFKMFMIFDVTRYRYGQVFHNLSVLNLKKKKKSKNIFFHRSAIFTSISMPMAHLFVSYFSSDEKEIFMPPDLLRRSQFHLDKIQKEHLYLIASLTCIDTQFTYCRVFFCGLFNNFFRSDSFIKKMDPLNNQKRAYYKVITEIPGTETDVFMKNI